MRSPQNVGPRTVRLLVLTGVSALVVSGATVAASSAAERTTGAVPQPVGAAGVAHFGGRVSAEQALRMLRSGPEEPAPDPELGGGDEKNGKSGAGRPRRVLASTALTPSPAPVATWQATTGDPPNITAALGANPSDPQIAVSSTQVVVGANAGVFLYEKSGKPYPSGKNFLASGNFYLDSKQVPGSGTIFEPLIDTTLAGGPKLGLPKNGQIDNFNDLRAIFDPYRKRFWIAATGTCRTKVDTDGDGKGDTKCAFTLKEETRRMVIGLAVSVDEDLTHGWYLYWWDAAPGWGTGNAPYVPGDLGDYPGIGINATTVDVSVGVNGTKGTEKTGRNYPHVALYKADDMAAGVGPTVAGWHLYPLFNANGGCTQSGLRNPDGTCPDSLVQPTLAHPDPGGSYLVSRHPGQADAVVVWRLNDLLQPTQHLEGDIVKMPFSWKTAKPAAQKGGGTKNKLDMSIGHAGVPLKSVWAWYSLFLVSPDANSSGLSRFRLLRLPTPGDNGPFDIPDPPNGGATQILVGKGSKQAYGWPAIEVNKSGDALIAYSLVGPSYYAGIRYNAWLDVHPAFVPTLQGGVFLKQGEATIQATDTIRWADLAGASVDFVNHDEADGIWVVHEYARSKSGSSTSDGARGIWVGKVFGKKYPDWHFPGQLTVSKKTVFAGDALTLNATLRNGGDAQAPLTSLSPRLRATGGLETSLGFKLALPLEPGAGAPVQLTVVVPADTPVGTHSVKLVVDPANTTEEYDEQNNTIVCDCGITVLKAPTAPAPAPSLADLVITRLSTTGFAVENVGGTAAGEFEVTVSGVGAFRFDELGPGARATRSFASPCSRTITSVTAVADARRQVTELDESNNSRTVSC